MSADIYDQIFQWCMSTSHLGLDYCIMYMSNNRVHRQSQCNHFTVAVFKICQKVFYLNNSVSCHVCNTVVICVIHVIYLQIRTPQSAYSSMQTKDKF